MRELEFLPHWYPQLRKQKRLVVVLTWAAAMVFLAMGLWLVLNQRTLRLRQDERAAQQRELAQTRTELRQLDELMEIKRQLQVQEQVMAKLGTHVEVTRML